MDSQLLSLVAAYYTSSLTLLTFEAKRQRIKRRHYLTRLTLQPTHSSAWRAVYNSVDDRGLLNTTGFDRPTFNHILARFQPHWSLHRSAYRTSGTAADVLGLCLQWLNSTSRQKTLCQVFAIPPATLSRLLGHGLRTLLLSIRNDIDSRIAWPTAVEMKHYSELISAYEPTVTDVFGFVDGVYFRCTNPDDQDSKNAYYNGWKSYCCINNVLVFAPDGCIIWARYNFPGSYHDDSRLARPLYTKLLNPMLTPPPFALVADTAFPRTQEMAGRIITPPKVGEAEAEWVRHNSTGMTADAVVRVRQAAEWGMHTLQSVFGRLAVPLLYDSSYSQSLLLLIFHLFNLRARRVQLNQTRSVYGGPL